MRIRADPGVDEPPDRSQREMAEADCFVDPSQDGCPICGLVDLFGRKWTLHLVWTLREEGSVRFNELERRAEGISPRVLSDRLDQLVEQGLVDRVDHGTEPPRVEYRLTPKGEGLDEVFEAYLSWAEAWGGDAAPGGLDDVDPPGGSGP